MSYLEQQRKRAIEHRDAIFRDPGMGFFMGDQREFVLEQPDLNLWAGIREDALDYFKRNHIGWWRGNDEPTGHMLSSQIACVNHLFPIRQRKELALGVLKFIDQGFIDALVIDDGFVEFEKVGLKRLGKEKSLTRGANSTSIDALMLGEKKDGTRILVLIEWKYTESYQGEPLHKSKEGTSRVKVYEDLISDPHSPIIKSKYQDLFYEPFYQLMRQTLLGWEMVKRREYGADDWLHVHVIPGENKELMGKVTSPGLEGGDLESAWKGSLSNPDKYRIVDPSDLLKRLNTEKDCKTILGYLASRYW